MAHLTKIAWPFEHLHHFDGPSLPFLGWITRCPFSPAFFRVFRVFRG
jgi:hypothetical protein